MNTKRNLTPIIFVFAFIALAIIFNYLREDRIAKYGIYTKGKIVAIETGKGGGTAIVEFEYIGVLYKAGVASILDRRSIGREFIIKFVPDNPYKIFLYEDGNLPSCVINAKAPSEGWKTLPSCP